MSVTQRETITRHPQFFQPPTGSGTEAANPNCKGPFELLLDALHDSRRRQASRAIHQYRHLIAAPRSVRAGTALTAADIFEQPKGKIKMTTSDDVSFPFLNRSTKARTGNGMTWLLLTICVIGFGILHIAGGAIINGAVKPTAEMPPVQLNGD